MSKATNDSTSRRTIIQGAAVLAASIATVPAMASQEDPELVALGEELERYLVEMYAQLEYEKAENTAHDVACRAAGLPWNDDIERSDARLEIETPGFPKDHPRSAMDEHGVNIEWDRLHDWQIPLVEKILALQAHTLKGLGVQARAVSLLN